jgi:Xaa-Pro aminopeptidase
VNVRYLTGFESTNAALLVDADRAVLFSDFRYAERARDVEGVDFEETKRYIYSDLPALLPPRVAFEADGMTYASCAGAGSSSSRGAGSSRRCGSSRSPRSSTRSGGQPR